MKGTEMISGEYNIHFEINFYFCRLWHFYYAIVKEFLCTTISAARSTAICISVSYTHLDVYKRQVQESMTLKIAEVEKSVLTVEESMSTKISVIEETMSNKICAVEDTMANIKEQIINKVEQFMKIQWKQISEQTVPCLLYTSRCV